MSTGGAASAGVAPRSAGEFARHNPSTQESPGTQSPSAWHEAGQFTAAPEQTYGAHEGFPGAPGGSVRQDPAKPFWLHDWQAPAHAESQHTPWAQLPDRHCAPRRQTAPAASTGSHWPAKLHQVPDSQSASDWQSPGQPGSEPSHTSGAHEGSPALPGGMGAHAPTDPCMPHDWQAPAQGWSQHTPRQQFPD